MSLRSPAPSLASSQRPPAGSWAAVLSAFAVWGALSAGAVGVVLQAWPRLPQVSAAPAQAVGATVSVGDLRRLLQAAPLAPVAESRTTASAPPPAALKVLGFVANASGQGAALLQVGQSPARPYVAGSAIEPWGVVQSVSPSEIRIGPSLTGSTTLSLVPPKLPAVTEGARVQGASGQ